MVNGCGSRRFILALMFSLLLTHCELDSFNTDNLTEATVSRIALQDPLRILPLGDSITQGNAAHQSYRYPLWKKLLDRRIAFDFIGSMHGNFKGNPEWPDYKGQIFDPDHEGHWGWQTDEILNKLDVWMVEYTPDIVLMHLGTNDIFRQQSVESTLEELNKLIAKFREKNANVAIFIAKLIPSKYKVEEILNLNKAIVRLISEKSNESSKVIVVDQASGFLVNEDTFDAVHPNRQGEEKIAQKWIEALMAAGVLK